jgi:hypothetical protein
MARAGTSVAKRPLPPPLPPETRTVGQLVAETIRTYQGNVWRSLAIGVLPGIVGIAAADVSGWHRIALAVAAAPVFTISYVAACGIVGNVPLRSHSGLNALAAGTLVYLPFPVLASFFVLPGLVWLAFFGLVVPVALIESRGIGASFARALRLARADYVHMLGGLCTLAILVILTQGVVFFLLRSFADTAGRTGGALAGIVLSPLLFLGTAILYGDQAARLGSPARQPRATRRSDADLPDADDAHREGRADAPLESGPAA